MSRSLIAPLLLLIALLMSSATANPRPVGNGLGHPVVEEVEAPPADLERADIQFMLRGYFFARSAIPDREAPGGFGRSGHEPKRLRQDLSKGRLHLIARPDRKVAFGGRYEGFQVILANTTGRTVRLDASDSRLAIVREARDPDGRWRPIEYLPSSWCGNSYHRVFLPRNHYWSFTAPRYSGSTETTMRFVLEDDYFGRVTSNEFPGTVNPEQFSVKQGHTPNGLMDPYLD